MALVAMLPINWSDGIVNQSNSWMAYGVSRPVQAVALRVKGHAKERIFATDAMGKFCEEGKRSWCIGASSSESDDNGTSYEGNAYEETETEDEARRRNWKERGWAPWGELRTPEAQFAIDSLADGEEEPIISWENFQKLNKKGYAEKMNRVLEETARKEEEELGKAAKLEGGYWERPLVFTLTPPRDWPPPGWKVDVEELNYIRQRHIMVPPQELAESYLQPDGERFGVPRWEMFLKQYDEWVAVNKGRLEQEAIEVDGEYYAGRRRTGNEYKNGMYELPFLYPGQHYWGVVTYVSLYEGAFVFFGGVHDGWVPIRDNDWYEIRKHIKVGMRVHVEVMAKRDPNRFRFPVELRFVDPNIDHLIFRRFKHPPIFGRREDTNLDEVARESHRPYYPKPRPKVYPGEEETHSAIHPYIKRLWMVYEAEQMILQSEEGIDCDEWAITEEDDPTGEWANEPGILHEIDGLEVPTIVLHVDEKYLKPKVAHDEREVFNELCGESKVNEEAIDQPMGRFERRMDELNTKHQLRWTEEKEALIRDRTCRLEAGLPLEEPGRYADNSFWGKNPYDPLEPQWRHDYWGDPLKLKEELRKDKEPLSRPEETAEVDDLLDGLGGDATTIREEGVDIGKGKGFIYDDADAKIILGESEDGGTVNGTAAKSLTNVRQAVDGEEGDWNSG